MAEVSKDEIIAELESISLSIPSLGQPVVPYVTELETRRKVEKLVSLLQLANFQLPPPDGGKPGWSSPKNSNQAPVLPKSD
jgi:hypothetical protein